MTISTAATRGEALVDADWIAEHLHDPTVLVVEVDVSAANYNQGHIPGAVLWNAYADLRHRDYTTISTPEFEQLMAHSGASATTTLAFYGYAAHLGFWLARAYGHTRAVLLDGPREQWSGPWSRHTPTPQAATHHLVATPTLVTADQIVALDGVLLDVRSEAEYAGAIFWPSGAPEKDGQPGHIPGALNLPISELRTDTGFKPLTEISTVLARHDIDPTTEVTTYCTIGNRACQAWYALTHLLDYPNVAVYYGGWAEWGHNPTNPIERHPSVPYSSLPPT